MAKMRYSDPPREFDPARTLPEKPLVVSRGFKKPLGPEAELINVNLRLTSLDREYAQAQLRFRGRSKNTVLAKEVKRLKAKIETLEARQKELREALRASKP